MGTLATDKNRTIVVSALRACANFGKLLSRVEDERRSLVIEKRGTPRAALISIRDYVRLAAPEPEVLKVIGEQCPDRAPDRADYQGLAHREIEAVMLPLQLVIDTNSLPQLHLRKSCCSLPSLAAIRSA
jgi:prevent-host-death family protein